jgi:hypothetical protein
MLSIVGVISSRLRYAVTRGKLQAMCTAPEVGDV